ncbi:MAG: ribonuclease J [Candidatus Dormibacteraeota bacterium]|uniref:Ribonuclease J n=1 Tax=Candidatus Dormiibacter inghamiae TaxID=3127013 RepID=A0A934KCJ2_9BACT|nr:ribonuclease J [Candidatus Dormibacteraeota bacterium]MBJ7607426.1 ribonuclease J [Candidatus Dormibacteraeota bacterium]
MPALKYVPLGGLGEVGLNMWALEWENDLVVIDAGLMFGQDEMPGVDLVLPDPSYLLQAGRKVHGIFLSHGHEDHIGGLPFLLKRLNVPVFGTPLTLGLAKSRLREHRILRESDLREVRLGDRVRLGPFSIETVAVSHSIPDAAALIIETPIGRLLYTSDFKLEADPPYGRATDLERFRRLGEQGVLLMLSDSTNAEREGHSGSERDLVPEFERIFTEAPGRIVVASFASNIHRIQLAVRLAAEHGRRVAVAGRSLRNAFQVARELGHLEVPENLTVKLEKAGDDPRLVLLTAGSQGEPLSALARFAAQKHPVVNVRSGDWVILSARPIPGNERLVNRTINNLYRNGAERVFYSEVGHVHVSGHAYRDELRQLIELVRPRFFVPVHGEYRQLHHHAELAVATGIPKERVFLAEDGNVIEVTPEGLKKTAENVSGLVYVDGLGIGDVGQAVLRDRQHLAADGLVVATVGVDRDTGAIRLGPEVTSRGFIASGPEADLQEEATRAVAAAVARAGRRPDRSLLQEAVHDAVSQLLWKKTGRRPMVVPLVTEV